MLQQQAVDVPVLERGKGQAPRGAWPAPPEELLQLQWESDRIRQQATRPGVRMLGDGDAERCRLFLVLKSLKTWQRPKV